MESEKQLGPNDTQESGKDVKCDYEIINNRGCATVSFKNLVLTRDNPYTPTIVVTFEKQPMSFEEGKSYNLWSVKFDRPSQKMLHIANEAKELSEFPEKERVRAVLILLRKHLHYAYPDLVQKVAESNQELAEWVIKNTGVNAGAVNHVPLSEIFENEYCVCRHLSVAYIWLANQAGLQGGVVNTSYPITLTNIIRKDNGKPLFKSVPLGQQTPAHSWAEIQISDGTWIPVDPSTQLVGDTPEGLSTFHEAKYTACLEGFDFDVNKWEIGCQNEGFSLQPGQSTAEVRVRGELMSTKPTLVIGGENIPPSYTPYFGDATLTFRNAKEFGVMNVRINDVRIEQ